MEVNFGNPAGSAPAPTTQAEVSKESVPTPVPGVSVESTTTAAPAVGLPAPVPQPSGTQLPATRKFLLGDKLPSFKDVILPRMNVVASVGNLKDAFTPGSLVHDQKTVLYVPPKFNATTGNVDQPGTAPLTIYVVGIVSERFSEKVQGGGFGGQIVDTEDQVRAAGGTLDYNEWNLKRASGMKRFEPLIDLLVVIERPEIVKDNDTVFNFIVDGKKYALAAWALKGGAYTDVMKRVFNYHRLAGVLKEGYPTFSFAITTKLKTFKQVNATAWMPVAVPVAKTSEPVLKFIYEIAGAPV